MHKNDLLLSQIRRGLNGYEKVINKLGTNRDYEFIIAHETYCSGLAALYYSLHQKTKTKRILDIVEYPIFSQRSTGHIRAHGLRNPYSDLLTFDFAVSVANKYDYCMSTSVGQASLYVNNGCKANIDLIMNCRSERESLVNSHSLRKMYGFTTDDIVLVYPNRAYQHCGLELALGALAKLDSRFKLVVLGEVVNELTSTVEQLVAVHSLQDRFFITGMLDPSLLISILSEADVALVLLEPEVDNHRHSLPNRVFDAIAAQVPVVAFADTELSEFVRTNSLGIACGANNPCLLTDAIKEVIERHAYFKVHLMRAKESYSWERQVRKLTDYIANYKSDTCRALFVALKDVSRNDRVRRISQTLVNIGCEVDVVTHRRPFDSMLVDGVNYFCTEE